MKREEMAQALMDFFEGEGWPIDLRRLGKQDLVNLREWLKVHNFEVLL